MSDNPSPHPDPFREEVRELKRAAFARSGNDLKRHVERLRKLQENYKDRRRPPTRPTPAPHDFIATPRVLGHPLGRPDA